jgi:hypothetical protein
VIASKRVTRTEAAIGELRAFAARNESLRTVSESFPFAALATCAESDGPLLEEAHELLVTLLRIATRYDDAVDGRGRNCYEGNDLRRQAAVVAVLAHCRRQDAEEHVTALLRSVIRGRYYAAPGSPDIDKYDRDMDVERSEDRLALACAAALVPWASQSAESWAALRAARDHRHDEVRTLARLVQRVAPFEETPPSRFYDRFNALALHEWIPRLLSPERVRELCGADARDASARSWSPWCALALPSAVLHPACLPHPSSPIESLLGLTTEEALAIVYGGDDDARRFVITEPGKSGLAVGTRLSLTELEQRDDSGLVVARGAAALRALLQALPRAEASSSPSTHVARVFWDSGAAPEWMCPTVVPIPGALLEDSRVSEHRSALLEAVAKQERVAQLSVPDVVMEGAQMGTQRAFDQLFIVVCQALDARTRGV